jgi:hypothetical protein
VGQDDGGGGGGGVPSLPRMSGRFCAEGVPASFQDTLSQPVRRTKNQIGGGVITNQPPSSRFDPSWFDSTTYSLVVISVLVQSWNGMTPPPVVTHPPAVYY